MQREVVLTGIGGQGVQLAAKTLAMAATAEGRQVMMSSHYGGEMRGGQTEASVVVSDGRLRPVPILESAWSAYVMHPRYWPGVLDRLRPGGVAVVNTSVTGPLEADGIEVIGVPAGEIANQVGAQMAAGFVLLGAYAAATGMAGLESLVAAMKELVPPYRTQHLAVNEAALRAGAAAPAGIPS
ncbi:MAG TPA: 2-oxoacid:acceptor oxidoreductase family protein [Acidimicrobiales bacterium]|nr:2-oxoacid:acceptor oxidoreductase family protein [Acidimicrobiales bacterium]